MWRNPGRPATSPAIIAVKVRRALADRGASDEKLLSKAPDMGILHRKPESRKFTPEGKVLPDLVDAAKEALGNSDDGLLPFPAEVIDAALWGKER